MATTFIGKPISLISHSDVRYRGILAGIDPQNSTIQLSNVFSMGTESRRPVTEFIPPVPDPYEYIIFRASEVKDLTVDTANDGPRVQRSVHDDPAVIGASSVPSYAHQAQVQQQRAAPAQQQGGRQHAPAAAHQSRSNNSIHTAAASLETVERALGDLRVTTAGPRSGRRNGAHTEIKVPTTDFDFEQSNARFDKSALKKDDDADTNPSDDAAETENGKGKEKEKEKAAYNPKSSFFDTLTTGPPHQGPPQPNSRGTGRRGGYGAGRRAEERSKNVATFGEPGGAVGPLHIPWGRRGGGRGRWNGPNNGPGQTTATVGGSG
ncbi:Scd6-like Sm domain-containing protein [Mycena floridula]|nr:Scd6-like Sm domain-containing protein [Mycena floridula]